MSEFLKIAMGFIGRHCRAILLACVALPAFATDVSLVGAFGDRAAILSVDGSAPKTVKVGERYGGVTVIAVGEGRATIEVHGKRRVLLPGQHYRAEARVEERQTAVLTVNPAGHFIIEGGVNGGSLRFLVDTGATAVTLAASDADRLGVDYRKGTRGMVQTANGLAPAWRIKLDRVRIGAIELHNVDAMVLEQGMDLALLGMSFLNRVEMRREADHMTLIRRF